MCVYLARLFNQHTICIWNDLIIAGTLGFWLLQLHTCTQTYIHTSIARGIILSTVAHSPNLITNIFLKLNASEVAITLRCFILLPVPTANH